MLLLTSKKYINFLHRQKTRKPLLLVYLQGQDQLVATQKTYTEFPSLHKPCLS